MTLYSVHAGTVLYENISKRTTTRVVGADPRSFRSFPSDTCFRGYGRDKNAVYFEGVKIAGADPRSFVPVAEIYAGDELWWYGGGSRIANRAGGDLQVLEADYAQHAEGAFHGARRLEAEGFEVLGPRGYARSRNRAYFQGEEIAGIDAASFRVIPEAEHIAKDKHKVVVGGRVDPRLDAASFAVLLRGGAVFKDRSNVYWSGRPIAGADPQSFRALSIHYAADKQHVYYNGAPMYGADPQSFALRSDSVARDTWYGYHYDKRVCVWRREASPDLPMCHSLPYLR